MNESKIWVGDAPLLITKRVGRNFDYRRGEIIEYNEKGVLFNEDRRSLVNTPEQEYYSENEIYSLIGDDGSILIGEYPDQEYETRYFIFFLKETGTEEFISGIKLEPGKAFSYCVDPGEYKLESIIWERKNGDEDKSSDMLNLSSPFTVKSDSANYLGSIFVNYNDDIPKAEKFVYRMKEHKRPDRSIGLGIGFGLSGVLINEIAKNKGIVSTLKFQVVNNEDFKSSAGLPLRFTDIY